MAEPEGIPDCCAVKLLSLVAGEPLSCNCLHGDLFCFACGEPASRDDLVELFLILDHHRLVVVFHDDLRWPDKISFSAWIRSAIDQARTDLIKFSTEFSL